MDPLTVTSAVALLVLTKAVEKTGDKLGERVVQAANELWQGLQKKQPTSAIEIARVTENSNLSQSKSMEELESSNIFNDIRQLADEDKDFRRAVELAAATHQQQIQIGEIKKTTEVYNNNIGTLNTGAIGTQTNTINF